MDIRLLSGEAVAINGGLRPTNGEVALPATKGRNHALHTRSIERVIKEMRIRLCDTMTNQEMAQIACFSPCHFNRLFHGRVGIPPVQFYYALRLARARQLLIETDSSVTDICFDIGYNSLGTFVSRFTALIGMPPNAFRRLARQIAGMRLIDFRPLLPLGHAGLARARGGIQGTISGDDDDGGVIFTGLFHRNVPEGQPYACDFTTRAGAFHLPVPSVRGAWHVLSVSVPWTAAALDLLTLDGFTRGRGGPIRI
jgi:AraC family transcriptional regulator